MGYLLRCAPLYGWFCMCMCVYVLMCVFFWLRACEVAEVAVFCALYVPVYFFFIFGM